MRKRGTNKIKAICKSCGKEFETLLSAIDRGRGKYCSKSCANKEISKIRHMKSPTFGKNNPNWKNGISKDLYHYKKIQDQRYPAEAFARKKLTKAVQKGIICKHPCEICGNENSEAHHDDYSKPLEVRWLCKKHHRELHSGMGWNRGKTYINGRYQINPESQS